MRIVTVASLLLLSAFNSCGKKDTPAPAEEAQYVPGDLALGIRSGVPIERAFQLADSLHFTITRLGGFWYESALPPDSLAYVNRVLLSKPYLNTRGFTGGGAYVRTVSRRIFFTNFFFDMDLPSQQDWLATKQQLQLIDQTDTADMWLQVPVGAEKRWQAALLHHPIVRWAELNYIQKITFP